MKLQLTCFQNHLHGSSEYSASFAVQSNEELYQLSPCLVFLIFVIFSIFLSQCCLPLCFGGSYLSSFPLGDFWNLLVD